MHKLGVVCIGVAICSASVAAQTTPVSLKLPDGRQIYVSGLRRWTLDMLQDSLRKYSPGDSLQSHACAAVLRYKLHFADAAATTLVMGRGMADIVFVDVREPQDSARVHYRAVELDTLSRRAEWLSVSQAVRKTPGAFRAGAAAFLSGRTDPLPDTIATAVAAFLTQRRSPNDHQAALSVLAESPSYPDRAVAAMILANFPDSPETWRALFDGMLETDGPVKSMSLQALRVVSNTSRTAPDWNALAPAVNTMLDGTALFMLDGLIDILNKRPELGPQHAVAFLRGGGEMLVNLAENPQPVRANPATALLIKLHGSDLGSAAAWRQWVASLR